MNLLFITAAPPLPTSGGAGLRAYHFMRLLGEGHNVHLLCPATVREELTIKEALSERCSSITGVPYAHNDGMGQRALAIATSRTPDLVLRMRQPPLRSALRRILRERRFDLIHVVGLEAAASLFPLEELEGELDGAAIVLDALNAEYLLQERASQAARAKPLDWPRAAYSWVQAKKLRFYEAAVSKQVAGILATSEEDKAALERLGSQAPVSVVPNGADTARYAPGEKVASSALPAEIAPQDKVLLFTGTMDYRPNTDAVHWFVRHSLPEVLRAIPDARLVVMGRQPTSEVRLLAGRHVTVTGEVADDLPYFQRADLFVLPMRFGGGTRLKLLQAMASALPIVTTTMGASGIPFQHGVHGEVADAPEDFSNAAIRLLKDVDLAQRLGEQARALALTTDWSQRMPALESFYEQLGNRAGKRSSD